MLVFKDMVRCLEKFQGASHEDPQIVCTSHRLYARSAMYTYAHTYVYICVYMGSICMCIYIYIYIYRHICIDVCMCMYALTS